MTIFKEINVFSWKFGRRSSYCLSYVDAACFTDIDFCVVSQIFMAIKIRFNWGQYKKDSSSFLIGTSPELEMALFTLCFLTRPNQECSVTIVGTQFTIKTTTRNNMLLSAFVKL